MRGAGVTLVETVLALFLLTVGLFLTASVFLTGLRYGARTERQSTAAMLAQKRLSELRAFARQPRGNGFHYDDWTGPQETQGPDPDEPTFTVNVSLQPHRLFTPATSFESPRAVEPRSMPVSAVQACVSVWEASEPTRKVEVWSLIGEPERPIQPGSPLVISGPSATPLAAGAAANFTVAAKDQFGNDYPDVFFDWYVNPKDGNGTIQSQSRDGRAATFQNAVFVWPSAVPIYQPGTAELVCRAVVQGRPVQAAVLLTLEAP